MSTPTSSGEGSVIMTKKPVRRLRGHTGSILCCTTAPRSSPAEVITSSEDGTVRVFDLRNRDCSMTLQSFGGEAVASVALNPAESRIVYAAAGSVVFCVDLRMELPGRELQKFDFNVDEINQVTVNQKATYVAAADDAGEIKVIDIQNGKLYRTLHGVHTNICSTVQFHCQKPWEVISGGLDCKIVKWDFSKGRDLRSVNLAAGSAHSGGQLFNPPFIHALAVPEGDGLREIGRLVAVARGDGAVEVYDTSFEKDKGAGSKISREKKGKQRKKSSQKEDSYQKESAEALPSTSGIKRHLGSQHRGHSTAVSSITFANFGERGQYIVSGGNDKFVKIWNWRPSSEESQSDDNDALVLDIQHGKKVNWLSTLDTSNENLAVADTSKDLSLYQVL